MRITNRIIQNNSLTNINNNKVLQDNLSTQLATEKKISRPSEDPIIALRSLRLRTSVNQTEQYREKNAEDAESWLKVTEDSINTLSEIITDIRKQCVKGASDTLTTADRRIILEDLQSLSAEIYNTGNADFAGRSIFTGYRTSSSLTFKEAETTDYTIYEKFTKDNLDTINYVHKDSTSETNVYRKDITRFRLSYDTLKDGENASLTLTFPSDPGIGGVTGSMQDLDGDGTAETFVANITPTMMSKTASPDPYETVCGDADAVVFVPETGEILFGTSFSDALGGSETEMTVSYSKDSWYKGDLRPEHYFKCKDNTNDLEYNFTSAPEAEICYNIGVNQSIRINTNASECFNHDIARDITDIIDTIKDIEMWETELTKLKDDYKALPESDPGRAALKTQIDAMEKTMTFANKKLSDMCAKGITKAEGYLKRNNLALTNCGTRSKRLELIQNRLDTQLDTLKELKSENEDVDMAETAVKLSSAQVAYDASLMSTSKILNQSLLNYL